MFLKARPIWLSGKENEMNVQAEFFAFFSGAENLSLRITGATVYKVWLNGVCVLYGPSPAPKGYARVDILPLDTVKGKQNSITIEAAGYNCRAYSHIKQKSFIQAEIFDGDRCIAATGYDFGGKELVSREKKVLRYSFQRHFTEVWDFSRTDKVCEVDTLDLDIKYLARKAPLPDMQAERIAKAYAKGEFTVCGRDWAIPSYQGATDRIGANIDGFTLSEITAFPIKEFADFEYNVLPIEHLLPLSLEKGEYAVFECENNTAGSMSLSFEASADSRFFIVFDEKLIDGRFDIDGLENFNIISVVPRDKTEFTSFEVYGFKYFAVFAVEGSIKIRSASVIKAINPIKEPPALNCCDETLQKIYSAACNSARCNTLGIFMDCPSRERGGYIGDSYFSSQSLYAFSGNTDVEDDFIENFVLADTPELPQGMLPMCYPADHPNGNYIPQWAFWFVLQLEQYAERNKSVNIEDYRKTVYGILDYFKAYENEYGLLERLGGWNFVEWSKANKWTKGINFPSNMLYVRTLEIVARLFGDAECSRKAASVKEKIIQMSFNGRLFCDWAVRNEDGSITVREDVSEVCQHYAFFCGIADKESHGELFKTVLEKFGPYGEGIDGVEKLNAIMGIYIRMELLSLWGKEEQLIDEIKGFFAKMAMLTGTIWEHRRLDKSLNHGVGAYIAALLLKIYNK